jgi:MerR family transcriptional regulator, light-induced transcriptional regulator
MRQQVANKLVASRDIIAQVVTREYFEFRPELKEKWGEIGIKRCTEDTAYHISYLAEAIRFDFPILFIDYLGWTKILLASLRISENDLRQNLEILKAVLTSRFEPDELALTNATIDAGLNALPALSTELPTFLTNDAPHFELAQKWLELMLRHQPREGRRLIIERVRGGVSLADIYQHVFTPALYEVGRLWQMRKINEAEEHHCSQLTQTMLAILSQEFQSVRTGRSVVGFSVGNEMHEIGIRLVTDCFSNNGWDSVCLGSNVPTRNIDGILRTWAPDVVAISATMTYHLGEVQAAVKAIKAAKLSPAPKILVGGKPFKLCPDLGARMGADITAEGCADVLTQTLAALN